MPIVPADFEEGKEHIDRIGDGAHIGITGIAADDYGEGGDFVIGTLGQVQDLSIVGEAFHGKPIKKIERYRTPEEFKTALGIGEFEITENENLKEMKTASHDNPVPGWGFFEACSGEEAGSDGDIGRLECGEEGMQFFDWDSEIGIDDEDGIVMRREDTRSDRRALPVVTVESNMKERDGRLFLFQFAHSLGCAIGVPIGHDNNFEGLEMLL